MGLWQQFLDKVYLFQDHHIYQHLMRLVPWQSIHIQCFLDWGITATKVTCNAVTPFNHNTCTALPDSGLGWMIPIEAKQWKVPTCWGTLTPKDHQVGLPYVYWGQIPHLSGCCCPGVLWLENENKITVGDGVMSPVPVQFSLFDRSPWPLVVGGRVARSWLKNSWRFRDGAWAEQEPQ